MDNVKTDKLYQVTLRGLNTATGVNYNKSYVIAKTTDGAYKKVRDFLDAAEYGFSGERELESVKLLAENSEYTDTMTRLFQ